MLLISDYFVNAILEHIGGGSAYSQPTLYLALLKAIPVHQTASPPTEVSGGSYARQAITWSTAANSRKINSAAVTFPAPSADWATAAAPVVAIAITDASSSGNWLLAHALCKPRIIVSGDPAPKFDIGAIVMALGRGLTGG
jgi:hypothetical protein